MREPNYRFLNLNTQRLCEQTVRRADSKEIPPNVIHKLNVQLLEEHLQHMKKDEDKLRAL